MKKIALVLVLILLVLSLSACISWVVSDEDIQEMFDSLENSTNYVLLTHFELVIKGVHYLREDIKYNGKDTIIVFLEQDGYYSFAFSKQDFVVEFLFTKYENFEVTKLGEANLYTDVINSFFGDDCFWLRIDDITTDEFNQVYYCWNVTKKTGEIIADVDRSYEYSESSNRNSDYTFYYPSSILSFFTQRVEITNKNTGETKIIDGSKAKFFDKHENISSASLIRTGGASSPYVIGDDIYFIGGVDTGPDLWGDAQLNFIYKWNFNTGEYTYVTYVRFDHFQEWFDDMIILQ